MAFNKYGSDSFIFSVVQKCENAEQLSKLEEYYIKQYKEHYECYNILEGGETMTGNNNPFYGHKHSKDTIEYLSKIHKGKSTGKNSFFYGKDHSGENNGFYGKHHTDKSKQQMSESKKGMCSGTKNPFFGKHHSAEVIEKLSKKVICVDTGVVYNSLKDAAEDTGSSVSKISSVCHGKRNKTNNLHWAFV